VEVQDTLLVHTNANMTELCPLNMAIIVSAGRWSFLRIFSFYLCSEFLPHFFSYAVGMKLDVCKLYET